MKQFLLFLVLSFSLPAQASTPTEASVHELLKQTGALSMAQQMLSKMVPMLKKMAPNAPENFWQVFQSKNHVASLISLLVPIYQKHLTQTDIDQLLVFYKSPVGKKFVAQQPAIMEASMVAGQEWGRRVAQQTLEELKGQTKK